MTRTATPNLIDLLGKVLLNARIDDATAYALLHVHNMFRTIYPITYRVVNKAHAFNTVYRALMLTAAHQAQTLGELDL